MTRKDFVRLAAALHRVRPSAMQESGEWVQWELCRDEIIGVLAADNPRFDRERFYAACEGGK